MSDDRIGRAAQHIAGGVVWMGRPGGRKDENETSLDFKDTPLALIPDTALLHRRQTMKLSSSVVFCISAIGGASAFAPASSSLSISGASFPAHNARKNHVSLWASSFNDKANVQSSTSGGIGSFDGDFLLDANIVDETLSNLVQNKLTIMAPLAVALLPLEANAADSSSGGGGQLASAFAAYGHYLSLFVIVGCLVTERLTVKANMSDEEEDRLAIADTTLGLSGALLAYTGYIRATADWGKGFDYYAHEPIFWLKTFFVAVSWSHTQRVGNFIFVLSMLL